MQQDANAFDRSMNCWQQWQDSPWGRLRYALAAANLQRHIAHLGAGALDVLDVGGGDGGDAVALAVAGHRVTIVDNSVEMLTAAEQRARAAGVDDRVTCVEADLMGMSADVADDAADVVLCHNVLQYVASVPDALDAAVRPMRPGGLLSVMAINKHSAALVTAIRKLDPSAALAELDSDRMQTATFGTTVSLFTATELGAAMAAVGCRPSAHYGIRNVCDYIADDDRKRDPGFYAELELLEVALSDRDPYRHTARLFQLIGTRTSVPSPTATTRE
jgi:S-adenosylmethionine-dependent methyltransferase